MEEAEQFSKDNDGQVVELHQTDGWHFWVSRGREHELLTNSVDNYGDYFIEWMNSEEWEEYCRGKIQNLIDNEASLEDIQNVIAEMMKVSDNLYEKDDDEIVLTVDGQYWDTLHKKAIRINNDVHTFEIGVEVLKKHG